MGPLRIFSAIQSTGYWDTLRYNSTVPSDRNLALRLERAEAAANVAFVEARAKLEPGSGAEWMEVAGAFAMYDGPRSPCTQTFCLGMQSIPSDSEMDRIEHFFTQRGAPVLHEVSPLAEKGLLEVLGRRSYHALEFSSVMYQPLVDTRPSPALPKDLNVRVVGPAERELWVRTSSEGWSEHKEFADLIAGLARVMAAREGALCFLVECEGEAIAAGGLGIHNGVALLAGASTIPKWRKRGAQSLLLAARLEHARKLGCDTAMFCAEPGSSSQRNAERKGFRVAYTRTKFELGSNQAAPV